MIKDKIKLFDNFGTEVNQNFIVEEKRVGELSCLVIDNYFKDPERTLENFLTIPFDYGQTTLEKIHSEEDSIGILKPMGVNQPIHRNLTSQMTVNLVDILKDFNYIPMDSTSQKNYEEFEHMLSASLYTGHYYYPDMVINTNMQKCHPGNYYMNACIFLSDNFNNGNGISFYNLQYENQIYWKVKDLVQNIEDFETRKDIMDLLNYKYVPQKTYEKFEIWNGDEYFNKVFTVEAKYNRAVIFPGASWYQQNFDNQSEKYFIEACLNLPSELKQSDNEDIQYAMGMENIDYD